MEGDFYICNDCPGNRTAGAHAGAPLPMATGSVGKMTRAGLEPAPTVRHLSGWSAHPFPVLSFRGGRRPPWESVPHFCDGERTQRGRRLPRRFAPRNDRNARMRHAKPPPFGGGAPAGGGEGRFRTSPLSHSLRPCRLPQRGGPAGNACSPGRDRPVCRPAVGPRPGRTHRCAPTRNNRFRRENDTGGFGTRPYGEKPGCGKAFPPFDIPGHLCYDRDHHPTGGIGCAELPPDIVL